MCYGYEYFDDEADKAGKKAAKNMARKDTSADTPSKSEPEKVEIGVGGQKKENAAR